MTPTPSEVLDRLAQLATPARLAAYERHFPVAERGDDEFLGVRMGDAFALAKTAVGMPLADLERLLESRVHEARVVAVSVLDFEARAKRTTQQRRDELYELYLRRHDRIDTWDLVDRAAIHVVGRYLAERSRQPLHDLARSTRWYERRTAIVATMYLSRYVGTRPSGEKGDPSETFAIAEILLEDPHQHVQRAVGWALRTAGGDELLAFLDTHAVRMPRAALRAAIEKLPKDQRAHYRAQWSRSVHRHRSIREAPWSASRGSPRSSREAASTVPARPACESR